MDAQQDLPAVVNERCKPLTLALDIVGRGVGRDHRAGPYRLLLLKFGYPDVADFPALHLSSPPPLSPRTLARSATSGQMKPACRFERLRMLVNPSFRGRC